MHLAALVVSHFDDDETEGQWGLICHDPPLVRCKAWREIIGDLTLQPESATDSNVSALSPE